jgi:hypothetical protein
MGVLLVSPTTHPFQYIREDILGALFIAIGAMRLGGLIVNGARKEVTPWIRAVSASVGFLVYLFGAINFGLIHIWSLSLWMGAAVAELVNIYRATHDAKLSRII